MNMVDDITDIKECPECASSNIIYNEEKQQVICKACGLIYEPLAVKESKTKKKSKQRKTKKKKK
jgi:transcription initiation factor TFIIIB Brf1 subunit/transcription initiation factor TFIIB